MTRRHLTLTLTAYIVTLVNSPHLSAQQGQFVAGHEVYTAIDSNRSDRELLTDVWYPVDTVDAIGQPPLQYYQHYNDGADFWWYDSPFLGGVQGAVSSTEGPFPVIALSHGTEGATLSFQLLGETLATNGYVVVAPRHSGNAWGTTSVSATIHDVDRPADISFVVDDLLRRGSTDGDILAGAVDETRIGMGGYSRGAQTITSLRTGATPTRLTVPMDLRASGLFLLDSRHLNPAARAIDTPYLYVGGSGGRSIQTYMSAVESPIGYGLNISDIDHLSVGTQLCQFADELLDAEAPPEVYETTGVPGNWDRSFWRGCQDGFRDPDEVQSQLSQQAVGFFDKHVRGVDGSELVLYPASGEFAQELVFSAVLPNFGVDLLLLDPSGRHLGVLPNGDSVNEFPVNLASHEISALPDGGESHVFRVAASEVASGNYILTGSADESVVADSQLEAQMELRGMRNADELRVILQSSIQVAQAADIEPIVFSIPVPEPNSVTLAIIVVILTRRRCERVL